MGVLMLVRHGQASANAAVHDVRGRFLLDVADRVGRRLAATGVDNHPSGR